MELPKVGKRDLLKALRNLGGMVLAVLALLILIMAVLGITLSFPAGRVSLLEFAFEQADKRLPEIQINYGDISSPSIAQWHLESLTILRGDKPWISLKNFDLFYAIGPIFDKEIVVNNLSASSVEYHHQKLPSEDEPEDKTPSGWQQSQWRYLIKHLEIGRLSLIDLPGTEPDKPTELPNYTLQGSIDIFGDATPIKLGLKARSLNEKKAGSDLAEMWIDINSTVNADSSVTLSGHIIEGVAGRGSQGIIGRALKLPDDQEINFKFAFDIEKIDNAYSVAIREMFFPFQQQRVEASGRLVAMLDPLSIAIENGRISTGENIHTLSGKMEGRSVSAEVSLDRFPLPLISYWIPQVKNGQLTSQTSIDGSLSSPNIVTKSTLTLSWQGLDTNVDINTEVDGSYLSEELQLNKFRARVNDADIQAQGKWNIGGQTIDMRVMVNSLAYGLVNSLTEQFSLPQLPEFEVVVNNAEATLSGSTANEFAGTTVDASIDVDAVYQQQPVSLKGRAQGTMDKWNINTLHVDSKGNRISASGVFDLYGTDNALEVNINPIAIGFIRDLDLPVPPDLDGIVSGVINLSGPMKDPAVQYQLNADLRYPIPDAQSQPRRENLVLVAVGSWSDKTVEVENFSITYSGYSEREPILDASGRITLTEKIPGMRWRVNSNRVPMSLLAPYGWPDNNGQLSLNLDIAMPATNTLSGNWFESVSLEGDAFYYTNITNPANARMSQPVEWSMHLNTRENEDAPPIWTILSEVSLPKQNGKNNSEGNGKFARSGWLRIQAQPDSLYQFFGNRSQLPDVNVEAELDIASLSFLWPREHQIAGKVQTNLTLSGNIDAPRVNGPILLNDGTYANDSLGMHFSSLTLDSIAENNVLKIEAINAVGRDNGRLNANGTINWSEPEDDQAVMLKISAREFNLVQRRDIEGEVGADLELEGSFNRLVLAGEIEVSPFEISIAGSPGPDIPEIQYEYATEADETLEPSSGNGTGMPILILDLTITVDQQGYIRGRGLEAELKGNINLQGPVTDVKYDGEFKTVRGEFVVFGKRFELRQGEVGFNNQSTIILVDGLHEEDDTEIRAQLSGVGSDLKLKLTSVPALPEDEILARLIFGKSARDITPIQALQLARAVRTLQGGGGGFDPIGSTREILGVDTLTVDAGKSGVEVGAGKYLSDNVYLELERSADPAHPWRGNVLIELTPSISLESTTGGSGQQGASARLMWKKDY